jgi:hypothetical protein
MKTTLFSICFFFITLSVNSQVLGVYEFNGVNDGSGNNLNVSTQPQNSLMSKIEGNYSSYMDEFGSLYEYGLSVGYDLLIVDTMVARNFFSLYDLAFGFYMRTNSCNRFKIDSISLAISHSVTDDTLDLELKTSIDNFQNSIGNKQFTSAFSTFTFNTFGSQFDSLVEIDLKFHILNSPIYDILFKIDNIIIYGNDTSYVGPLDYYADNDGDGYGIATAMNTCIPPSINYSLTSLDCDDNNPWINPGVIEYGCGGDGIDNNCNGQTDEGPGVCTCMGSFGSEDSDGDGYWTQDWHCPFDESLVDCADWDATWSAGCYDDYDGDGSLNIDDCDYLNASIYPGAPEILNNGVDENCDGIDAIVGILESTSDIFFVYPNPGNNVLSIKAQKDFVEKVKLMDLQGKVVAESFLYDEKNDIFSINASHIEAGIYHLVLSSRNASYIIKWIKNE